LGEIEEFTVLNFTLATFSHVETEKASWCKPSENFLLGLKQSYECDFVPSRKLITIEISDGLSLATEVHRQWLENRASHRSYIKKILNKLYS
jgi:hypothetical protein